ncbi:hypothetical protein V5O48_008489 [Marasmius crinis-equi]|uniref:Uncharacterized protein n=1 Tax=Marasmius crinis-equi TaxID=585013 RepID=A0ABR3FDQ8_9AGAR
MSGGSSSFFQHANHPTIGDFTHFYQAETVTNNNNNIHTYGGTVVMSDQMERKKKIVPIEHNSKEIDPDDIIFQNLVSKQDLDMVIKQPPLKDNNPFQARIQAGRAKVKITRTVYTAEIMHLGDRQFTVYMFEPKANKDEEALRMASHLQ